MSFRRALLAGWFSFEDGEATAGDVLALRRVEGVAREVGLAYDVAWSPAFRPGELSLATVRPERYDVLVFVCGPLHGPQVAALHEEFGHCRRVAVGVSVIDPGSRAVRGFAEVIARDGPPATGPRPDLSAGTRPPREPPPVVATVLTSGQHEYAEQRRHEETVRRLTAWLGAHDCARLPLETRLDTRDWRLCATPEQVDALLARSDLVVTNRLHGLVLALRVGVPVIAVDPVAGGAKVSAQARALDWPAVIPAERLDGETLQHWWDWARAEGRARAAAHAAAPPPDTLAGALVRALGG
ncbi:polysaccharide pyruvyl transferase family protein [Streptomyces reniochalinae]|uniref:Polysaccharide pyruvyl transferase family protein n=1 Tax=Streptomyces reniochalinae TaxID=2250578 RepID=A0A367E984_9ACTN|nr:polysaccharide pyruvyl transferase family protein [Streptomyces reniochalinae]RCG14608.1 polysaccharide pyruvyl transferase family protein [Streptomyces reniochalinae]